MKKVLFFLTMLAVFCLPWVNAQVTLTVCDGTGTNSYVPIYGLYTDAYLKAEFVMPADSLEDMAGGTITGLQFYASQSSVSWGNANFQVFLVEVDDASISAYHGTTDATIVYEGSLSIVNGQLSVTFSNSYTYNGGNLLIGVYNTVNGSYVSSSWYGQTVTGASVQGYSTAELAQITATQRNFLPKTTFTYTPGAPITCAKPTNVQNTFVNHQMAYFTWDDVDGASWQIANVTAGETPTYWGNPITNHEIGTTGLTGNTQYDFYVRRYCSSTDQSTPVKVSYKTKCEPITNFPWSENFNSLTSGIPNCWDNSEGTTTDNSYKWNYYATGHDGAGLRFNSYSNSNNNTNFLKTPVLNFPAETTMQLSFWYKNDRGGDFSVYISTDGGETYTTSLVTGLTGQSNWKSKEIILSDYTGQQNVVIVFKGTSNFGYGDAYIYLDDVEVKEAPSCLAPTVNPATSITTTSAELSWTANSGETAWTVYYKKSSETDYSSVVANSNPYTLEGLTSATTYDFYVVANCSETDQSTPSAVSSFTTACEAISEYPYTESFDSYTSGSNVLPLCWNYINTTTYSSCKGNPRVYSSSYQSTPNCLYFYSYDYPGSSSYYDPQPQYAILPEMENLAGKQITLYAKGNNASSKIKIGTINDPADASTFTMIAEQALTTSYQEFIYNVPANATDHYIAIMIDAASATSSAAYNEAYIDDITINVPPACPKPTELAVVENSVTAHTAQLSWTSDASAWQICLNNDETNLINVTEKPYTLTGLTENTKDTVKVRAVCGSETSEWSTAVIFTTPIACPAPTELEVTDGSITANGATVSWTGESDSYDVMYRRAAYNDGIYEEFNTNSIPTEWEKYTGLLQDVINGTDQLATTTSGWNTNSYALGSWNAKVNIYGGSCKYWLVTPEFNLTQNLSFDLALTDYGNGDPIENNTAQADDRFVVLINSNNVWTILREWNNTGSTYVYNNIPNTGENVSIDLSAYQGQNVKIAFYGESTESGGDNDLHIDNVYCGIPHEAGEWQTAATALDATTYTLNGLNPETTYDVKVLSNCAGETSHETDIITFTTVTLCQIPDGLEMSEVTAHTAQLSWNAYGQSNFNLRYSTDGTTWNTVTNVNTPYTLTGLTASSEYQVQVQAACNTEEWSTAVTFTTPIACPAPTALAVTDGSITTTGATVSWEGTSDSYYVTVGQDASTILLSADFDDQTIPTDLTNGETYPWTVEEGNGGYAIKSSNAGIGGSSSTISVTTTLSAAGTIAFDAECKGEGSSSAWDKCIFSIDGVAQFTYGAWVNGWNHYSYNVTDGEHIFTWTYSKDSSVNPDGDYFAVDNIVISITNVDWEDPVTVTDEEYAITGLDPETTYFVKVQGDCGEDGLSAETEPITIKTKRVCTAIIEYPWTENFDSYTGATGNTNNTNNLPDCWNYYNGTNHDIYMGYPVIFADGSYTTYSHTTPNCLRFYSSYYSTYTYTDQIAILPEMQNISNLRIKLYAKKYSSYEGSLDVGVMSDPTDITTFVSVGEIDPTSTTYEEYIVNFNTYTGSGTYIALKMTPANSSSYGTAKYLYVDDITVEELPSCLAPTELAVAQNSITATSAELSWTSDATAWQICLNNDEENLIDVTQNPYTLEGLTENTEYTVKVRAVCDNVSSEWCTTPVSFTTLSMEECYAVTLVTNANQLAVGDQIVLVSAEQNVAMSTTQNDNNRGVTIITKSADSQTLELPLDEEVQVLTLQAGNIEDAETWALYTGEGYLYAASSNSNYLRTEETLDANGNWTITIGTNGVATITAQGENTRNLLRYNSNSSIFSCYASGQDDIVIYKFTDNRAKSEETLEYAGLSYHYVNEEASIDTTITTSGDYTFTVGTGANGCDSLHILHLTLTAPPFSVTFNAGTGTCGTDQLTESESGAGITLPEATACETDEEYTFAGWAAQSVTETSTAPVLFEAGSTFYPTKDTTLYAVYKFQNGNSNGWEKTTSITAGDQLILVCESKTAEMTGITLSGPYGTSSSYTSTPSGSFVLEVQNGNTTDNTTYSFWSPDLQAYLSWSSGNSLSSSTTQNEKSCWIVTFDNDGNANIKNASDNSRLLRYNAQNPRFACYTSTQTAVQLYRLQSAYTYNSNPECAAVKYNVQVSTGLTGGTITADKETAAENELVTLTATPDEGYIFKSWNVTEDGTSTAVSVNADNTFTMPASDVTVSATFVPDTFNVTFVLNGAAFAEGYTPISTYWYGQVPALPTADNMVYAGHTFDGWYQYADFNGNNWSFIPDTAKHDLTYYAKWTTNVYTVTTAVSPENAGSITGINESGEYEYGSEVSLTAVPAAGFDFEGWWVDHANAATTTDNPYSFTVTEDTYVEARFVEHLYKITVTQTTGGTISAQVGEGEPFTTTGSATALSLVQLANTPAEGYLFSHYTVTSDQSGNPMNVMEDESFYMPYADVTVTAVFTEMDHVATPTFAPNPGTYTSDQDLNVTLSCETNGAIIYYTTDGTTPTENSDRYEGNPIPVSATTTFKAIAVAPNMINSEVAEATYTINQVYNVTIDGDITNGTVTADTLKGVAGDVITLTATPDEGYIFKSWTVTEVGTPTVVNVPVTDNTFTMPASDVNVSATFVPDTFNVTFVLNGAAFAEGYTPISTYWYGQVPALPTADNMVYAGHTFDSWYQNADFEGNSWDYIPDTAKHDLTYYAKWTTNVYTVTTAISPENAGSITGINESGEYEYGSEVSLTAVPAAGFDFEGWWVDHSNAATTTDNPYSFTVTEDTYVEARFVEHLYKITVTQTTGGSISAQVGEGEPFTTTGSATALSLVQLANTPAEGYLFSHYTVTSDRSGNPVNVMEDESFYMPFADVTVTAVFTEMDHVATPTFAPNPGTYTSDQDLNVTLSCETNGAIIYYTTDGTTPTENSDRYEGNPIPVSTTTTFKAIAVAPNMINSEVAEATYTINQVYNVTINGDITNGTVTADTLKGVAGDVITLTATPDEGYIFKSWNVTEDGTSDVVSVNADNTFTMPASDVTVSATFVPDTFTVTVVANPEAGGVITSGAGRYPYSEEVNIEFEANDGYEFDYITMLVEGAEEAEEADNQFSMPAGNVTVTVYFQPATYNLTLETNQGTLLNGFVRDNEYTFGQGFTLPTANDVEYTGHTFGGWYSNYSFTGDPMTEISTDAYGDTTVYAKWTPNEYLLTIIYQFSDETTAAPTYTSQVTYNTEYSVTSPTVEGYSPDQTVVSGIMPAEPVTVTVTYGNDFFPLTIHYLYADGTEAHVDVVNNYAYGSDYSVASPAVATYMPNPTVVTGTMSSEATEVTVTYTQIVMNEIEDIVICNGGEVPAIAFSSSVELGEMSYAWQNSEPTIGLSEGSTGNIEAFNALNNGTEPVVATVTVTPTCTYNDVVVDGVGQTFTITVNPSLTSEFSETACDSYYWTEADTTIEDAGTNDYRHTFTTQNGCDSIVTLHLTLFTTPAEVVATAAENTSCDITLPNGSITVSSPAGEGFEYSIDNTSWQTETLFDNLAAGDYTIAARPVGSECAQTTTITIGDNIVMPDAVASVAEPFFCANAPVEVNGTGSSTGEEYTYAWTGPNSFTSTDLNASVTATADASHNGTYTLIVTNTETHCSSTATVDVVVNVPETPGYAFTVTTNGDAYANIDEGQTETSIVLADPTVQHFLSDCNWTLANDAQATYDTPGDYTITWTATDDCGNTATATQVLHVTQNTCPAVVDYDNNSYPSVSLGRRCWMAANLKTTHFADGREVTNIYKYQSPTHPDAEANVRTYGLLYDWYDALDAERPTRGAQVQGVCPTGWHVPDEEEFAALSTYDLYTLRSTSGWLILAGDNSTGFNMLPAGQYNADKDRYENLLGNAYFWSADSASDTEAHCHMADCSCYMWYNYITSKNYGFSVRCVKNE